MKGLFIVFHGFSAHSGISKKIFAQCEALRRNGVETELCHLKITPDGTQLRRAGQAVMRDFGSGLRAKVLKRISYADITDHIRSEGIEFLYIRHDLNANPLLVAWLRRVRRLGVRIALEIPTYPYDAEFRETGAKEKLQLRIDRIFRRSMARQVDRIVTFSDDDEIFGQRTVRISNGIDFGTIPIKAEANDISDEVHLLALANIHPWHGFDRVIEGLGRYYAAPHARTVRLRVVGDGLDWLLDDYRRIAEKYGITPYVEFTGPLSGAALDAQFAWCDMGVASLARHRNGIESLKSLKNREYAARGIPFVYSERDSDFDTMPYVVKAPADDTPLDIAALLDWLDAADRTPGPIRASIEGTLSWERQMQRVITEMTNPD